MVPCGNTKVSPFSAFTSLMFKHSPTTARRVGSDQLSIALAKLVLLSYTGVLWCGSWPVENKYVLPLNFASVVLFAEESVLFSVSLSSTNVGWGEYLGKGMPLYPVCPYLLVKQFRMFMYSSLFISAPLWTVSLWSGVMRPYSMMHMTRLIPLSSRWCITPLMFGWFVA